MTAAMVILGSAMVGFQIPELVAYAVHRPMPYAQNFWWAVAAALVAGGLVL